MGSPSDRIPLSTGRNFAVLSLHRGGLAEAMKFVADVTPDTRTSGLVPLSAAAAPCGHDLSRFFLWVRILVLLCLTLRVTPGFGGILKEG